MAEAKNCIMCGEVYYKKQNCSRKNWAKSTCCSSKCSIEKFKKLTPFLGKHHSKETKEVIRLKLEGTRLGNTNGFKVGGKPRNKGVYGYQLHGGFIKTKLQVAIRTSQKFLIWRKQIFERDNYTCQDCGIRCGKGTGRVKLHAHHLKAFSEILHQHNIQSFVEAMECNQLWDISNGQTLCKDCHKKTESYKLNQYSPNIGL